MNTRDHRSLRRFILAGILVALAGSLVFIWQSASQPKYEGRSLGSWFVEYCHSGYGSQLNEGLKHFDTNAVPYLIEQAYNPHRDSAWRTNYCGFLNRLPQSWGLPRPVAYQDMHVCAGFALLQIQPPARQLLPLLQKYMSATNVSTHHQTLFILGGAGDGAELVVPYLIAAINDPDTRSRDFAMQALENIRGAARAAKPVLLKLLYDPNSDKQLKLKAAVVLGHFGSESAEALSAKKILFDEEDDWFKCLELSEASLRIDPGQTYAMTYLTNLLKTTPAMDYAAYSLGELGVSAQVAAPALLEALTGTNFEHFPQVARALKKMGVTDATVLPFMKKQLTSTDESTRINAAASVLQINPADHEAHLVLMDEIKNAASFQETAITVLGQAGPAAAEAIPILRETASHNPQRQIREWAVAVLKQIDPTSNAKK